MSETSAPEPVPPAPRARGRAVTAIVAVGLIAVVTAGGIVAWARFGISAAETPPPAGLYGGLPEALADGRPLGAVPQPIADAVEGPVVAAVRLDEQPAGFEVCQEFSGISLIEPPTFESGVLTPDGAQVSLLGRSEDIDFGVARPEPALPPPPGTSPEVEPSPTPAATPTEPPGQRVRLVCTGSWQDGEWQVSNAGVGPADEQAGMGMGGAAVSGDGNVMTVSSSLTVPDGVAWAVQDRGEYRLAYPVEGLATVAVEWRFRESGFRAGPATSPITLLDADGEVVDETVVSF